MSPKHKCTLAPRIRSLRFNQRERESTKEGAPYDDVDGEVARVVDQARRLWLHVVPVVHRIAAAEELVLQAEEVGPRAVVFERGLLAHAVRFLHALQLASELRLCCNKHSCYTQLSCRPRRYGRAQ